MLYKYESKVLTFCYIWLTFDSENDRWWIIIDRLIFCVGCQKKKKNKKKTSMPIWKKKKKTIPRNLNEFQMKK